MLAPAWREKQREIKSGEFRIRDKQSSEEYLDENADHLQVAQLNRQIQRTDAIDNHRRVNVVGIREKVLQSFNIVRADSASQQPRYLLLGDSRLVTMFRVATAHY